MMWRKIEAWQQLPWRPIFFNKPPIELKINFSVASAHDGADSKGLRYGLSKLAMKTNPGSALKCYTFVDPLSSFRRKQRVKLVNTVIAAQLSVYLSECLNGWAHQVFVKGPRKSYKLFSLPWKEMRAQRQFFRCQCPIVTYRNRN